MEGIDDDPREWPIHHLVSNDDSCLEEMAMVNAYLWLHQAANGETPHGGIQCQPHHDAAKGAAIPSTTVISSSSPEDNPTSTTKTAGGTPVMATGTVTCSATTPRTTMTELPIIPNPAAEEKLDLSKIMDGPEMMPLEDSNE